MSSSRTINIRKFIHEKEYCRLELMSYLIHSEQCRDIIYIGPEAFISLHKRLRATSLVKDAFQSIIEEH